MTRTLLKTVCLLVALGGPAVAEESETPPRITDLDFLVGTWAIRFEIHDTHAPERGVIIIEEGTQTCRYDLTHRGEPQFIVCDGAVRAIEDSPVLAGRARTFRESIRYNRFINGFERIGIFSNWPSHSEERVFWHPEQRVLELRGRLDVQDGLLERYEDLYTFSEDFSAYERRNVANFSDMPETLYRLTLAGTGRRIDNGEEE